jgi:hypothetical protein
VISHTTEKFWKAFNNLPRPIQTQARETYSLWRSDHYHPSLQFKLVHRQREIYSVRIGIGWRALGVKEENMMIWFWIGPHAEYDRIVSKL